MGNRLILSAAQHISPRQMVAFTEELTKVAGPASDFVKKHLAGRYGRQLAVGAGLGGVGNVLRHRATDSPEQREQSSSLGQFLRGGLAGAGVAGGRIVASDAGRKYIKGTAKDIFQRERHSLTGKGLGKTPAEELRRAQELGIVGATPKAPTGPLQPADRAAFRRASARHGRDVAAFKEGLTSGPGVVHGMLSRPGHTLKETLGRKWQHGTAVDKAWMGIGGAAAAKGVLEKPEEGGPGRLEKGLGRLGATAGYMMGPSGWIASSMLGGAGGKIGTGVGKAMDRVLPGFRRAAPSNSESEYYPGMMQNV